MRLLHDTKVDFLGKSFLYLLISSTLLIGTIVVLFINGGPLLGIDFTGGTFLQIGFKELPPIEEIRKTLDDAGVKSFTLQSQPSANSVIVRVKEGEKSKEDIAQDLIKILKEKFPGKVKEVPERVEFVGPAIGKKFIVDALLAIFWSMVAMIVYVAFRFKNWVWGFTSVLALVHDVIISVGVLTLLKVEINLVVVAALLTLAGYSMNDTIVIFDRVRENLRGVRKETPKDLLNRSLNETLGRTVNTALIAFLASLALYVWGGNVIHEFAFTYCFGVIIGSYSTFAVAVPLAYTISYAKKQPT